MSRRLSGWLLPWMLFVAALPVFAQGVADVNVLLRKPGEVSLGITWEGPPWGARMRVEYGGSSNYGSGTEWLTRAGYPFSGVDTVTLPGTQASGDIHYRIVIEPIGGPPGQATFTSGDSIVATAATANEVCKRNCPDADSNCRLGCDSDSAFFEKALAQCRERCRPDDPDCEGVCQTNLGYVSLPPVWSVKAVTRQCPQGYSPIGVFAEVDWNCSPLDSEFCKHRVVYSARATLSCAIIMKVETGTYYVNEHDLEKETLCSTKRGMPQKVDEAGWWATKLGELQCFGDDAASNCRVRCPE